MTSVEPSRERWQPLRSGLVDVFRYDEQEFLWEDGRLLLRGNNGTGKSRVLALQLPFLLDGEVAPHRLEPDGDPAKRIEWNLLLDSYERRLGYTWIEFGRRDEHGVAHYLTLGCGLNAVRGKGTPSRWFFLTRKRVGEGLFLQENRTALHKDRLRAAIGDDGEVHDTVDGWRQAVDRALFRLGPRYRPLLDLLIQLRQPQLSRDLDERKLSRALSMALPPLSPQVVEPLAEAFRALEADRAELLGFREAVDAAGEFLGRYRSYAGVAARRRAARLRTTHAAYEDANRKALRAEEALVAAVHALGEAKRVHEEAAGRDADARTRLRTLEQAPAMDLARELENARESAAQAGLAADRATTALRTATTREAARRTAADAARRQRDDAARVADEARAAFEAAAAPVGLTVEADRAAWDRAVDGRRLAAAHLARAEDALAQAEKRHGEAAQRHEERRAGLDHAREAEVAAGQRARAAGQALTLALASWTPTHLALDAEAVLHDLAGWIEEPAGRSPIETAVAEAERRAIVEVEREKAARGVERDRLVGERAEALSEIARLSSGGHAPPAPWPARARDAGVAGAPLWRLCDFAEEVGEAERRGIEAALEGAGLLDAWVTPDGAVLPSGARDAALTLDAPVVEPSLAGVLLPVEEGGVAAAVIRAVLARIGLGNGAVWVAADGRYGLGPLRGAWEKGEAEHIGETARERARQRRVAELRERVSALDAQLRVIAEDLAALDARAAAIRLEADGRPDDRPVRDAALAVSHARRACAEAQSRLVEAETALLARRREEADRRSERDANARDLGLLAWIGRRHELAEALGSAHHAALDHYAAVRRLGDLDAADATAQGGLAEAVADLARDRALAEAATRAQREAEVRRDVLQEAHGAAVGEILAAIEAAKRDVADATAALQAAGDAWRATDRAEAEAQADARSTSARAVECEQERDGHVARVRALVDAGLVAVLEVPPPEGAWSTTRAVDLARRLEDQLATVAMDDAGWSRVQDALHRDLEELRRALIEHRWDPVLRTWDELCVVEVSLGDTPLRVPELRTRLDEEVRTREAMLTAREREVIENHLVGELATELHELIHQGEALVREMSREVEARATSTGMRLRFDWRLREEAGTAVADARKRLMRQGAAWSPADRDLIASFLEERLDAERAVDRGATWQQQIERAFDYREWHTFVVERHQDGQWKALTRRTHGTGSGGEKAIALTIPQLAAAAAYYRNADRHAPRLILLDEAFVGVDSDMRAKCMGLFATFDLDFLMTSEREWACYATLPGVAICQLATSPGIDAVDVVRWVWNGRERRQG